MDTFKHALTRIGINKMEAVIFGDGTLKGLDLMTSYREACTGFRYLYLVDDETLEKYYDHLDAMFH